MPVPSSRARRAPESASTQYNHHHRVPAIRPSCPRQGPVREQKFAEHHHRRLEPLRRPHPWRRSQVTSRSASRQQAQGRASGVDVIRGVAVVATATVGLIDSAGGGVSSTGAVQADATASTENTRAMATRPTHRRAFVNGVLPKINAKCPLPRAESKNAPVLTRRTPTRDQRATGDHMPVRVSPGLRVVLLQPARG